MADTRGRVEFSLALGLFVSFLATGQGRAERPEAKDLRRGLLATYRGSGSGRILEVSQWEPAVALALKDGEAPHPRLPSGALHAVWDGYIHVQRNGTYRFSVWLRGEFSLKIAGKDVLSARSGDKEPALKEGAEVKLEAGVHPFAAEFKKLRGGGVRVELLWQGSGFRVEPLPFGVLGHRPPETPALAADALADRGRFLFEEASCVRCHQPDENDGLAKGLKSRAAPNLTRIGRRAYAGWIARWLEAPQKVRPGATMPQLFADDEGGRAERYAVARYLATLGGPLKANPKPPNPKDQLASARRGQKLFNRIGCVVCHNPEGVPSEPGSFYGACANYPLQGLGSKTTPEELADYLKDPLAIDPSGRMPRMLLQGAEALDLARFLCQSKDERIQPGLGEAPERGRMIAASQRMEQRAEEIAAFEKLPPAAAWADLGKRLVIARGCNNCHAIEPDGKPFAQLRANADLDDLKKLDHPKSGCLADRPDPKAPAPHYDHGDAERTALRAFLKTGLKGAGSPAPGYAARIDLQRFNCLACHSRDGAGGLPGQLVDRLRQSEKAESAEAISPPPLTGVARKLRAPWLRQVLTGTGRARSWLALRMPQFGAVHVGKLPEGFAALEGTEADETIHKVALDTRKIEAGRLLVGKTALGCISCHDIAGVVTGGTRGPDLALMNQRVRYDWYRRWLEQAQRMQPGTRMPEVFQQGKSLFEKVYDGQADAQAEAIWAYLSLGPTLPLPAGLERPK